MQRRHCRHRQIPPDDVGVLVCQDQRANLLADHLVELAQHALHSHWPPVQLAREHHRAAAAVTKHGRADLQADAASRS